MVDMTNTAAEQTAPDIAQALAWRMAHIDNGVYSYREMMAADEQAAYEEEASSSHARWYARWSARTADTQRPAKIAAIHALADWYAQHPEEPMPDKITCVREIRCHEIPNESIRLAMLQDWADAHNEAVVESGLYDAWTTHHIDAVNGIRITMYMSAVLDHKNGTK